MSGVRLVLRGLHDTFENLVYFAVVSLGWWICVLTIVLGPAATIALFVHADPRHGTVTDRPSFAETRAIVARNLWSAWKLVLIVLPLALLLVFNIGFYAESDSPFRVTILLWIFLLILAAPVLLTAFALVALDRREPIAALKSGFILVGARLPAVFVLLVLLTPIVLLGSALVIPAACFLPATIAAVFDRFVLTTLRVTIPDPLVPTPEREAEGPEKRRFRG